MKILLADDHRMMRDGLRSILEKEGMEVVGEASSGREALAEWHRLRPDIIVMDISMPDLNGIDATRRLVSESPGVKIIGLSMNADRRYVLAMLTAGASAYLLKSSASEELIRAIAEVASGRKYVSPAITDVVIDSLNESLAARAPAATTTPLGVPAVKALSVREREVLQLIAEGASSKEIATRLGVSSATIDTHRRQIMDKLGIRSIAELTKYAIREGITTLE